MFGKEILKARTRLETTEVCHNNPDITCFDGYMYAWNRWIRSHASNMGI